MAAMDHLIGQRFNLISKSEIRYVGTLHEINAEQSTIALENVFSFGTEDRPVAKFIPPSQDKYGFIVFRGSDVKDIKIAEDEPSQPSPPPSMPNDPAILNASRPGPPPQGPPRDGPFSPQGFPPPPHFGGYYPPGQFGRGYGPPPGGFGPGPGPGPGFTPYGPPPPGYFGGPPGQGFPPGPPGFHAQPPIGPPGQQRSGPPHFPQQPQQPAEAVAPGPSTSSAQTSELPVDNKGPSSSNTPAPPRDIPAAPFPQAKAAGGEHAVKAGIAPATSAALPKTAPTGPKNNRVTPAIPLTVNQKSFIPPAQVGVDANGTSTAKTAKPATSQAAMDEAARQAKEAVAAAMAKLNPQATTAQAKSTPSTAAIDALSQRVNALTTNTTTTNGTRGGRGSSRGARGGSYTRGGGGAQKKMEIPQSDFDFESANAKFNKEDLIKEAIASGSPPIVGSDEIPAEVGETESTSSLTTKRKDSLHLNSGAAYNKTSSFFDNISSEAKDREDSFDARGQSRQLRGEEFKKNIETFGQGNVDGGYRGGRGRGGYGRGRNYNGNRGYNNRGFGGNNNYRGNRGRGGQGYGASSEATPTAGQS